MTAAYRPLQPRLTAEQEEQGWAIFDAWEAAKAAGDELAELDTIGDFLDWQMATGLLTRERWREMTAHMLPDAVRVLRSSPAGRAMLAQLRKDAAANLKSADYRERAGAALFLHVSAPPKRKAPKRKPAQRPGGITREVVDRSAYMAERIQSLLGAQAFDEHKKSRMQHADDAREAYSLARRIARLLGGAE